MLATLLFWFAFAVLAYVYAGYPILLHLWRLWGERPIRKAVQTPRVSVVMAAYNESAHIDRKLKNLLAMDYPEESMEIIVSIDGATDATSEIASRSAGRRVTVFSSARHCGKATALNRGVALATGEIVVFVDARQDLDRRAIAELMSNFSDASVGAVSGELVLLDDSGKEAADGVGLYWRYEKWLRTMESSIHSTLGATGAIYAIRRHLVKPIPDGTILDDVAIPMHAVLNGARLVFDSSARAYDHVDAPGDEYARKVRTLTGNFQLMAQMPELLLPWRNPVFPQFLSHKVGRLVAPYCLAGLFISNLFMTYGFYLVFLILQCAWYGLAIAGGIASRRPNHVPPVQLSNPEGFSG